MVVLTTAIATIRSEADSHYRPSLVRGTARKAHYNASLMLAADLGYPSVSPSRLREARSNDPCHTLNDALACCFLSMDRNIVGVHFQGVSHCPIG